MQLRKRRARTATGEGSARCNSRPHCPIAPDILPEYLLMKPGVKP
jgi:hypothetical protein